MKNKLFESISRLPPEDSGLANSICRLNNCHIDSKRQDCTKFFRREPVIIINRLNKAKVLRYVMGNGNPGTLPITKSGVGLDYDAADMLGVKFKQPVALEIRQASFFEIYGWFRMHPDLSVRLSIRLGMAGGVLGILGFLTGIIPLFLT